MAGMFELAPVKAVDKPELYAGLQQQLTALITGERDFIANAANTAALIWHSLPDLNWTGFYRLAAGELVLGPFQGRPACVRISLGKGVCGTAAIQRKTVMVPNVHTCPGHIVCDPASNSEIVVPLIKEGRLLGVLDLDSPKLGRFDALDQAGLERIAELFVAGTDC
jgi:L-methionine (R)-S-oxide reductase